MKILLAAGGTGGHIWPAISFAEWIRVNKPDSVVSFICGNRDVEKEIFTFAGISPTVIPMEGSPLSGNLTTKLSRWNNTFASVLRSKKILKDIDPDISILFGGYAAFPVIFGSLLNRIPIVLHEQNARAGKVTRFSSRIGVPVCSGWEKCLPLKPGHYTHTGIPVREMIRVSPEEAWKELGYGISLPPPPRILVLGGSLGSGSVSSFFNIASRDRAFQNKSILVLGTGKECIRESENLWILPREWRMELLYSLADAVVARAGASTLSELVEFGLPSVIIPWKGAADDHQMENAKLFAEQGNGSVCEIYNGVHQNLSFMIDYEQERARPFRPDRSFCNKTSNACNNLWKFIQQTVEGRGRN